MKEQQEKGRNQVDKGAGGDAEAAAKPVAAGIPASRAAEFGAKGGRARAANLTDEERRNIAAAGGRAKGAKGRNAIRATHAGQIKIGSVVLDCANLPDGRRVLSESAVMDALGRGYSGYYSQRDAGDANAVPRYLSPRYLQKYIPHELQEMMAQPIWYIPPKGKAPAKGIDADALPAICDVWLQARADEALDRIPAALNSAKLAELLVRGLARVGIAALIDEATGIQAERNKRALQAILDRFLVKELAEWAKRFPDDFYEQIYRLRGWEWRGRSVNPPGVVGYYTKDLVYSRIAPGLLQEMQKLAATEPKTHKLHQWLSKDGQRALETHFHKLNALMKAATSWDQMLQMVERVMPKNDAALALPLMMAPAPAEEAQAGAPSAEDGGDLQLPLV